jgi:serine/threonine-protein kinase BUR1
MYTRKPILTGHSDLHQAQIIFELVGAPTDQTMPGWEELPGAETIKNIEKTSGRIDKVFGK